MVVFSSFMTGSASVAVRIIFCVVSDTGSWHTWTMLILFVSFSTSPLESSQLNDWKNALLSVSARYISGVVHTYPEIRENGIFFFYEYGLRPHVSSVFSSRIRKFLKTLSRVEIFLSNMNTYTCGRSYPEIFEYAFVILLDPVFTASIINKHGVQQGCSFFTGCSDF